MWENLYKYIQNEYIQVYVENKFWIHVYSEYGKSTLLSSIIGRRLNSFIFNIKRDSSVCRIWKISILWIQV